MSSLERIQILNRAWKHPDFIKFIQNIRFESPGVPLAIYMDNLTIHKMNIVKYVYERLDIMPILNIPYCPEFHPIDLNESVFSQVKRVFKAERLKKLANLEPFDAEGCIADIFWNLNEEADEEQQSGHRWTADVPRSVDGNALQNMNH